MTFCKQSFVGEAAARCRPWKRRAGWTRPDFSEILTTGQGSRCETSCVRARYGDSVRSPTGAGSSIGGMVRRVSSG
jgi:hypothetical protein